MFLSSDTIPSCRRSRLLRSALVRGSAERQEGATAGRPDEIVAAARKNSRGSARGPQLSGGGPHEVDSVSKGVPVRRSTGHTVELRRSGTTYARYFRSRKVAGAWPGSGDAAPVEHPSS